MEGQLFHDLSISSHLYTHVPLVTTAGCCNTGGEEMCLLPPEGERIIVRLMNPPGFHSTSLLLLEQAWGGGLTGCWEWVVNKQLEQCQVDWLLKGDAELIGLQGGIVFEEIKPDSDELLGGR